MDEDHGAVAIVWDHALDLETWHPVPALGAVFGGHFDPDPVSARVRAAEVVASALGSRLLEPYLVAAGHLDDVARFRLRDELNLMQRLTGATPLNARPPPVAVLAGR